MRTLVLKLDLHVHTCYSSDALATPKEVLIYAKKRGLDGVAITDHDTIDGAHKLSRSNGILIIPGVEVNTSRGHILGLNISDLIPSGLDLQKTIELIHDHGGVAVAAHPTVFSKRIRGQVVSHFDAIEVINASAFPFLTSSHLSRRLAVRLHLPQTAGSDAHYAPEIGYAYTIIDAESEIDEIVQAIKTGRTLPFGRPIPWKLRLKRTSLGLKRKL